MNDTRKKAIVIGAGVGGTATAARLAHAGLDVEVYEKNAFSGGRCSLVHHDGYRFDQGPSLLLLPPIFHQLYRDLGTTTEAQVDLVQCHPNYVIHYHDGERVVLSSDRAELAREVEKWEGQEGPVHLDAFLNEAAIHGRLSYSLVLSKTFHTLFTFLRLSFILNVIKLHPYGSMYGRCARYFTTERMRRAFSFGSMYLGSSPFDNPGTYTLLQWTETCEGIWYPRGGFHAVVQSLVDISTSLPHPVTYHFSTPVSEVLYEHGRATGVKLANGQIKQADVVVVNADLAWAQNNLFKDKDGTGTLNRRHAQRLIDKPHSCSSISFYWAMNCQIPSLNVHNIFLAEDYKGSFDDIFKDHSMPREPSFYVNVPSRIDPTAAPPGNDAITVLVPVGHLNNTHGAQDWDALVDEARGQVIHTMETRSGIKGLKKKIRWESVNTPLTWQEKFNLTHGSILGITHNFLNVLAFRQQARHASIKGAYFVGASAHPGTGVPIVIASSRLCVEAILSDLKIPLPLTYSTPVSRSDSPLDVRQPRSIMYILEDWFTLVLPYLIGAFVALAAAGGWMRYTDRLFPKPLILVQQSVQPSMDLDPSSPIVLGGALAVVFLSVAYTTLRWT